MGDELQREHLRPKVHPCGHTLIELTLVMVMLGLFGLAAFSLVSSSGKAYRGISEQTAGDTELRVAISYIDTKIRQNDVQNAIRLEKNPLESGQAIVITENLGKETYETWIYTRDGKMKELLIKKGSKFRDDFGFEISQTDQLTAQYDNENRLLKIKAGINFGTNSKRELETAISVKTRVITD